MRSWTEAELAVVNDHVTPVLWHALFVAAQGFPI